MRYRVYPLLTGHFTVAFNASDDLKFPKVNNIPSYIFLLVDEKGDAIVVDTGFDTDYVPAPDSFGERLPEQEIPFLIKQAGFDPLGIKKIIQTHLHWDHAAGIKHFPNAEIFIQSGEIRGLFNLREFEEISFCPVHWIDRLDSFILTDGDKEIIPGIEAIRAGSHTRGHQAVKIKGEKENILLLEDSPFSYEWLWTRIPAFYWNRYRSAAGKKFFWREELLPVIDKWYRKKIKEYPQNLTGYSMEDLQAMGDIKIFSHDPGLKDKEYF